MIYIAGDGSDNGSTVAVGMVVIGVTERGGDITRDCKWTMADSR